MSEDRDDTFQIKNLTAFAKSVGKEVAKDGGFTITELKEYITVTNIKSIIKQRARYSEEENTYLINTQEAHLVCEDVFDWMNGVSLAKLAADGFLECWWDEELDSMDFEEADIKW
jgi:hypothetical protein